MGLVYGPYDARKLGNFSHCFSASQIKFSSSSFLFFFSLLLIFYYLLFVGLTGVARASFVVRDFPFMFLSIEAHMVCSSSLIFVDW